MSQVGVGVGAVEDGHTAPPAPGAVQEPAGGRALAERRDDLDEGRSGGQRGVGQAEFPDPGVAAADLQAEDRADVLDHRFKLRRHPANLAKPQVAVHPF